MHNRLELYLIRHAETVMNTNPHLVGGRSNETKLTPKGVEQSIYLGETLLSKRIVPANVFTSPAVRTIGTAHHSLKAMGLSIAPIVSDEIQELGQGSSEGKLRSEVYTPEVLASIDMLGKDFKLEGGESMNDVGLRMLNWLNTTFQDANETHFVYTHGGSIRYLASTILDWSHAKTLGTEIDNISVNLFVRENGVWSVAYLNKPVDDL